MINKRQALEQIEGTQAELRTSLVQRKELRHLFLGLHKPHDQAEQIATFLSGSNSLSADSFGLVGWLLLYRAKKLLFDEPFNLGEFTRLLLMAGASKSASGAQAKIDRDARLVVKGYHAERHRRGGTKQHAALFREALVELVNTKWTRNTPPSAAQAFNLFKGTRNSNVADILILEDPSTVDRIDYQIPAGKVYTLRMGSAFALHFSRVKNDFLTR